MLQKALVMLLLFALATGGSLLFFINLDTVSPENPLPLREVKDGVADLATERLIWGEPGNKINQVAAIENEPDLLQVKVDYVYSGDHGESVMACGAVDERANQANWQCKPAEVKAGSGSVTLEFQMSDQAPAQACSKYVVVTIFRQGEAPFYSNYFHYKKAWIRGASGMWGRFEQFFHSCQS